MKQQDFFNHAQAISLSRTEKTVIREALLDAMQRKSHPAWWLLPFKSFASVTAAVVIVVASGIGASFAAEEALPGDLLYPLKVHVMEEARLRLLARTPIDKMKAETLRAERRLYEAEVLARRSALNEKKSGMLAKNIKSSVQAVQEMAMSLLHEDAELAASVGMDLEATLAVHGRFLRTIAGEQQDAVSVLVSTLEDARMDIEETNIAAVQQMDPAVIAAALDVMMKGDAKERAVPPSNARTMMVTASSNHDLLRLARAALHAMKEKKIMEQHPNAFEMFKDTSSSSSMSIGKVVNSSASSSTTSVTVPTDAAQSSSVSSASSTSPFTNNDDLEFSTRVRIRMTEERIKKMEETMKEQGSHITEDIITPSKVRMDATKALMKKAKMKMAEEDAEAALEASDDALRHADETSEALKKLMKRFP